MEQDKYFSGSFENLKTHWDQVDRAIKFQKGGTRSPAVKRLIHRLEMDIHQGSWIDVATGSGFTQTLVEDTISPILFVGFDFSSAMLRNQINPLGERVLGTCFRLPFRSKSFSLITNIFSLSDYPNPEDSFADMASKLDSTGSLVHLDYAQGDEYWETRKLNHGKTDKQKNEIIGDIHLRNLNEISKKMPPSLRSVHQEIIEYSISPDSMAPNFDLPDEITRRFIFSQFYKPRS